MTIRIQQSKVPLATFIAPNGQQVRVYITQEHRRPLDDLVALVYAQQAQIEALTARLVAGGL